MIPLHATATADPQQLRWVVAAERLPTRGAVRGPQCVSARCSTTG